MITWRSLFKRFLSDPVAIGAGIVLRLLVLMAVFAP